MFVGWIGKLTNNSNLWTVHQFDPVLVFIAQ